MIRAFKEKQKEDVPESESTEATREGKPAVLIDGCCDLGHGVDSFTLTI